MGKIISVPQNPSDRCFTVLLSVRRFGASFHLGSLVTPTRGGEQRDALTKDNIVLRGCVVRNTDYIEGIVAYAGHETKVSSRVASAISDLMIGVVFD